MGASFVCCERQKGYKSNNLHIYQINRYYSIDQSNEKESREKLLSFSESRKETAIEVVASQVNKNSINNERFDSEINFEKNTINNNENSNEKNLKKKQILNNEKGQFQLLCYDIEEDLFTAFIINFPIIKSIEGLSELYIKPNFFYLCGISPKKKNEGSFLFQIKINSAIDEELNAKILINSQSPHVYPSLISDEKGQIICVGGKGQTQCELFNLFLNKWYVLPQLPEERYKCNLCIEPKKVYLYLFGGINTKKKKNDNEVIEYSILRMDLIKQLVWEKIIIKNDSKNININRHSAAFFTFLHDEDFIFLIGGEDSQNKYLDNIIRYSINKNTFELTGTKLDKKAKFVNQYGIIRDEQTYYFIDSLNQIHLIERHDCLPIDYNPQVI